MIIPYQMLATDTLLTLIQDFVTRDGTDNGDGTPLEARITTVELALKNQQAFIFYDEDTQTCSLLLKQQIPVHYFTND